jgi:AcrR family transcriptional regulator
VTATERERRIQSEQAQEMIRMTRELVYERGISAANVREIARRSKVALGWPDWLFGSKGRLLVEVLRFDHDLRLNVLRKRLEGANTREELVEAVQGTLRAFLDERTLRGNSELMAEITRLAIDDEEVANRRGELRREYRDVLARVLGDKQREGVVRLVGHATSVAALLISLAQGLAVEITADRGWRPEETIADARVLIEALLSEPRAGGK